ncbi:MAG: 4-hydroxythreonine-4-phosphate dehydrogenase PdxA [Gammaproteobacteria bacterium TMED78]|nr:MAG: 4-hydroxythreonine-4-phosphate dehydrogenase PdxA [Gammaproteobacteria bacterium TMED78]
MKSTDSIIILTSGEPAGIGPDICAFLANENINKRIVVLCDHDVIQSRIKLLSLKIKIKNIKEIDHVEIHRKNELQILHVPVKEKVIAGILNKNNSKYVLNMIDLATHSCKRNKKIGMINCPIQKSIINDYGIKFNGHTDYIANLCGVANPVMMLASDKLRVALATDHIPLNQVTKNISEKKLRIIISTIFRDLNKIFFINNPKIAVIGLNPHAGENGYLGKEELISIKPIISEFKSKGYFLDGPFPADTAFNPKMIDKYDAFLAMYHDQGLPVIKALSFGNIVNISLGLPITRASVDHGTALELAGTGKAKINSLVYAINQISTILDSL